MSSARGFVTPNPKKRPKFTRIRFEAEFPNECWQGSNDLVGVPNPTSGQPGPEPTYVTIGDDPTEERSGKGSRTPPAA